MARSGTNRAEHSQMLGLAVLLLLLPTAVFFVFLAVEVTLAVGLLDRGRGVRVRVDDLVVADACDLVVTMIVGQRASY